MPHTCIIQGCSNRSNKCNDVHFYPLPLANSLVLRQWIIKAKIPQRLINKNSRVCSSHFKRGKRNSLSDIPEIFPWSTLRKPPAIRKTPPRSCKPPCFHIPSPVDKSPSPTPPISNFFPSTPACHLSSFTNHPPSMQQLQMAETIKHDHTYCISTHYCSLSVAGVAETALLEGTSVMNVATQCVTPSFDVSIQCFLPERSFDISHFCNDDDAIHFYTGLPDYQTFIYSFKFLGAAVHQLNYWYGSKTTRKVNDRGAPRSLTPLNEYFLGFVLGCWNRIWHIGLESHSQQCHVSV